MKILRYKVTSIILSAVIALSSAFLLIPTVTEAASDVITSTVNIAIADKNQSGPGYYWANRYDILTLTDLHIDTEEAYGLRLPKNCTVELNGNNYIKASKYGISCTGTVVFKGEGSLTIDAGEIGIYIITQDSTQKVRLINGDYVINAANYGVYSEAGDFSFVDGKLKISTSGDSSFAIYGRCVNILGGVFSANAPVQTTHELVVDGVNIEINAASAALTSKNLEVKNISVEYNGENSINAKSTASKVRDSIIFGDKVPGWVDYVLLAVFAIGIASAIFVPSLRRKKKAEELYKRLESEGYDVRR